MASNKEYDVMISYEHKSGEGYMKVLYEKLKSASLKVWVDKEEVSGNIYDSMAKGVASSHVMIILLSEGYAKSFNCKLEMKHTNKCGTKIIPVKLEDYTPPVDSALSILLSDTLYYKAYGSEDCAEDVIHAVKNHLPKINAEDEELRIQDTMRPAGTFNLCSKNEKDEKQPEAFDVIFSYDLNSGKKHKNKLLPILHNADIVVYDNDDKLQFPEIWTDKMAGSCVVILLLSRDYCQSEICEKQFECAVQANKKIIPVITEKFEPSVESPLWQFMENVDSFKLYKNFDANAMKVVRTVKQHLYGNEEVNDNTRFGEISPDKEKSAEPNKLLSNTSSWNPTINIYGGNVIIGDNSSIHIPNNSSQQSYATQETIGEPRSKHIMNNSNRLNRPFDSKTYNGPYSNTRSSTSMLNKEITQLSPDEALHYGLERGVGDLNEDFREELAMKLDSQSAVVANWVTVARALRMDPEIIERIKDKGTAHRLLFNKIRDSTPHLRLYEIKEILENKMKRKVRKDIFYDYLRKENLPSLDKEIGSLNNNEFELVLENIADKLIADPIRGHWRNLGGHLGFKPFELDEIMSKGRPENVTSSARIFIDHLGSKAVKIKEFVSALKSDTVKRMDVNEFMTEILEAGDCWN